MSLRRQKRTRRRFAVVYRNLENNKNRQKYPFLADNNNQNAQSDRFTGLYRTRQFCRQQDSSDTDYISRGRSYTVLTALSPQADTRSEAEQLKMTFSRQSGPADRLIRVVSLSHLTANRIGAASDVV